MKYFFTLILLLFLISRATIGTIHVRRLIRQDKLYGMEKHRHLRGFRGYHGAGQVLLYTTGIYDSSSIVQEKMYAIARQLKNDSLMVIVYRAIGNRQTTKTDYNFALSAYFKMLEYAKTNESKALCYGNIAYLYAITGNNQVAMNYLKKSEASGKFINSNVYRNTFYGLVFNNLNEPDSALVHLQKAADIPIKAPDVTMQSILLAQISGVAYELKGDADLAEVYYKRVVAYCKTHNLASGQIRHGSLYCDFCIKKGNYAQAKTIALENLAVAKKAVA